MRYITSNLSFTIIDSLRVLLINNYTNYIFEVVIRDYIWILEWVFYIHLVCICMWGPQDDVWFLLLLFSTFIIFIVIVILIQSLLLNLESNSLVGLGSEVSSICLFGNYHLCKPSLIPLLEYYNSGQLILFIKEFYNIISLYSLP